MKKLIAIIYLIISYSFAYSQHTDLSFEEFTKYFNILKINNDSIRFSSFLSEQMDSRHIKHTTNGNSSGKYSKALNDLNAYGSKFSSDLIFNYEQNSFKQNVDILSKIINLERLSMLLSDIWSSNNTFVLNCFEFNEKEWYVNYSTNFDNVLKSAEKVNYYFNNCEISDELNNKSLFNIYEFKSVNNHLSEVNKYSPKLEGKKVKSEETGKMFVPKIDLRYKDNYRVEIEQYTTLYYEYDVNFVLESSARFDDNGEFNSIDKKNEFNITETLSFDDGIVNNYFCSKDENSINVKFDDIGQISNYFVLNGNDGSSFSDFNGETIIFDYYDIFRLDSNLLDKDFILTTYYIDNKIGIKNNLTNKIDSINNNDRSYLKQKIGYYKNDFITRIKQINQTKFNYKYLYHNHPDIEYNILQGINLGRPYLFEKKSPFQDSLIDYHYFNRKKNRISWMDEEQSLNWFLDMLDNGNKPHYLQFQYNIFKDGDVWDTKKEKEIIETNERIFIVTPNTFFQRLDGGENGGMRDYFLVQIKPDLEYYYFSTYFGDYTSLGSDIYCRVFDKKIQINFSNKFAHKEYQEPVLKSNFDQYKDLNFTNIIKDELINEYTIKNYLRVEYFRKEQIILEKRKQALAKAEQQRILDEEIKKKEIEKANKDKRLKETAFKDSIMKNDAIKDNAKEFIIESLDSKIISQEDIAKLLNIYSDSKLKKKNVKEYIDNIKTD